MVSSLKPYQQPQTSKINRRSIFRNKLLKKHLIEQVMGDEVGDEFLIWLRIYRVKSEDGFCYLSLEMVRIWKESGKGIVRRFFKKAQVFIFDGFREG